MRSTQQHNPMVDLVHYQLEATMHLAEVVFSGTEKIDRAMLDVTHQAVDGQLKLARAVTDMRDPTHMAELQVSLASRPEKAMHCQQQIMSALIEIQTQFGRSIRDYLERFGQSTAEQAGEAIQQGETVAGIRHLQGATLNPFAGMLSVWEEAFREAGKLASQNMMAASTSLGSSAAPAREITHSIAERPAASGHQRQVSGRSKRQVSGRRKA